MKNQEENAYRRGRHCVTQLHAHLVFVTKKRRGCLDKAAIVQLKQIFTDICADFCATLKEVNAERDHVHLLVEYPPKVSLSKLVNSLKGVSSRLLRRDRPDLHHAWGVQSALWSPSYFAASCGGAPINVLKAYIQSQKSPAH